MQWRTANPEATENLGALLADSRPTDGALVVLYLTGDLGAGKTTMARGFLRACHVTDPVRSPTYTLVEVYETHSSHFVHVDLYRLRDAAELETLGLRDWARPGWLWLVEWPDRGRGYLPAPDLVVTLTAAENHHDAKLAAGSPAGESWLRRLKESRELK